MDSGVRQIREKNPRETASIFSIITFFYTFGLYKKSKKKILEDDDVYEVVNDLKSRNLGDVLENRWKQQEKKKEQRSLARAILFSFGLRYILLGVFQFVVRTALIFIQPTAISRLVAYFQPNQQDITRTDLYQNVALVIGLNFLTTIYNHNYEQFINEIGVKVRTAVAALIYRKALRLTPESFSSMTTGKIVTLITKDVFAFENALTFVNDMWIGLIQTAIIGYLIYKRIGFSIIAGLGFYLLIIPFQFYVSRRVSQMRLKSAKKTDERIQMTTEVLSAIKTIKMYTWETIFGKKIIELRKDELRHLSPVYYLKSVLLIAASLASNLSFYFLLMTYIWMGHLANAEIISFIQANFQSLKSYITVSIPYGLAQGSEVIASLKRLNEFLNVEEVHQDATSEIAPKIHLNHVLVTINNTEVLKDVSMSTENGLFLVTGSVGSGKTSLLKTILREYVPSTGELHVSGSISYAPQDPWLFPSTIKQNILFGQEYNEERYNEVLRVCALQQDFASFEIGDQTIAGDKGVNLSKGQQSRISLARAVYRNSDIYLLDDCLAALDNRVNMFVFQKCIKEFLKDKIVILVTSNINHIRQVNSSNTLFIENGKTLSLEEQEESLDRRITYYMDDLDSDYFENIIEDIDETEKYDEVNERTGLLDEESTNIYHENKLPGKVSLGVYLRYYKNAGGLLILVAVLGVFTLCQVTTSFADKLLSSWVKTEPKLSSLIVDNLTNTTEYFETVEKRQNYLNLYCVSLLGIALFTFLRVYLVMGSSLRASGNLHKAMTNSVVNSFMTFFDSHYLGNIINRFSKDLNTTDEMLPLSIYEVFRHSLSLVGVIILIATVDKFLLIPAAVLLVKMYYLRRFYIKIGRNMKRLDSATRSPMIGYLNASLEGLPIAKAHQKEFLLIQEFDKHQDLHTSAYYMMICATRAFAFMVDLIAASFVAAVVLKIVFNADSKAGDVNMVLGLAMGLSGTLQWAFRQYSELENNMTAVERVLEYSDTKTENKHLGQIIENWPNNGIIEYRNVSLAYGSKKQQVLKNINFVLEPREKIGIIGRTGAGKSSIISTLFRLYDIDGNILVDGVDTKTLPIGFLRSSIAIIPQDPILFTGNIRSNIDPTGRFLDEEIWNAMESAHLKDLFPTLEEVITENGSNYSSGQKQLICLARALISKNKIIVLDEATASMDPETCRTLQKTIKKSFGHCTVLTIAHRLNTVSDSDRILVIDHGEILEFDSPSTLLANTNSHFYKMVKQSGLVDESSTKQ